MNTGKYIFAQLIEFLPQRIFDRIVIKYEGNKYVKHFTCWNQLIVMMFGQLSNRDSLRDLTSIISAHSNKTYHLGFGKNVTRSNLAKVNERREPLIFEELKELGTPLIHFEASSTALSEGFYLFQCHRLNVVRYRRGDQVQEPVSPEILNSIIYYTPIGDMGTRNARHRKKKQLIGVFYEGGTSCLRRCRLQGSNMTGHPLGILK